MKFMKGPFSSANLPSANQVTKGLLAAAVLTGVAGVAHKAALAQAMLQEQGTLAPMEDTYTFTGETGQTMTIELESEDFDTILLLKGPDGEVLTSNDDYGGTLNSTIVVELPESGEYSAVASAFDGRGGSYQIEVRPASEYEVVFSRAYDFSVSEDYDDAIEAYTAAIEIDDTDPGAYLGRAEATVNRAYISATTDVAGPEDLPQEVVDAVVADYLKAADLLEQQGQAGPAESLREQAQYFTGEPPTPQPGSPAPGAPEIEQPALEEAPDADAPDTEDSDIEAPDDEMSDDEMSDGEMSDDEMSDDEMSDDAPIPVEPDGGIGDGAEPLPEDAPK